MRVAVHVGSEHDPLAVRSESDVGLQPVVMLREIDELLGLELSIRRTEEINPLAVPGCGDAARASAVAGEIVPSGDD